MSTTILRERRPPEVVRGGAGRIGLDARLLDIALIAVVALVLRLPTASVSVAVSADESAFILAAREVVLGHLPYLTFWDHKPLGSTLLMAGVMAVFGQSIEAMRGLGAACVIVTAWALYAIAGRLAPGRAVPLAAGLLYVVFSTRLSGIATITEIMLAPFTAIGVLLLLRASERRGEPGSALAFAGAGLAFGLGVWVKYVPVVPAAMLGALALLAVLLRDGRSLARTVGLGAAFSAGLLFPTVAGLAFYWWVGELDAFWYANFGFVDRYVELADHPRGAIYLYLRWGTLALLDFWPLALAALGVLLADARRVLLQRERAYAALFVGVWLAAEALAVAAQLKFYNYHFLLLLPPLSVAAAAAVRLHAAALAVPGRAVRLGLVAYVFLALTAVLPHMRQTVALRTQQDVPRRIAEIVASELMPGDPGLFVVNHEPIIYFLARTGLPTRYAFPVTLIGPHQSLLDTDARAEVERILATRPRFMVMNESWRDEPTMMWDEEETIRVERVLEQHYRQRATWILPASKGTVTLYVRND
jgi:4-amino-4-deoxy-L-arabinose transferase-like glycosyltransferase